MGSSASEKEILPSVMTTDSLIFQNHGQFLVRPTKKGTEDMHRDKSYLWATIEVQRHKSKFNFKCSIYCILPYPVQSLSSTNQGSKVPSHRDFTSFYFWSQCRDWKKESRPNITAIKLNRRVVPMVSRRANQRRGTAH